MADDFMHGIEAAMDRTFDYLAAAVPPIVARLDQLRGRPFPAPTGGEPDPWGPPKLYARTDRALLQPEHYPAVLGVPQGTEEVEHVDEVDGGIVLVIPYRIRLFVFVRAGDHDSAAAARDRLALAITQALLVRPTLRTDAEYAARTQSGYQLRPFGWRTSYSEVGVDLEDQRHYAGWWIEFVVDAVEAASPAAIGTVDTIRVDVDPVI